MPFLFVGLALGLMYWLLVVGSVVGRPPIIIIAALLAAVVLGPIWYAWLGVLVRGQKS